MSCSTVSFLRTGNFFLNGSNSEMRLQPFIHKVFPRSCQPDSIVVTGLPHIWQRVQGQSMPPSYLLKMTVSFGTRAKAGRHRELWELVLSLGTYHIIAQGQSLKEVHPPSNNYIRRPLPRNGNQIMWGQGQKACLGGNRWHGAASCLWDLYQNQDEPKAKCTEWQGNLRTRKY